MAVQESALTFKIVELTEKIMADADLRASATQSGCCSSSGGVGNSSSTSGSALANLTASLAQTKLEVSLPSGGGR
jgi:hypothetical protein